MNRKDARKIAETITNEQLMDMFNKAKTGIKNWEKVSVVNKSMSKGAAWNILASKFTLKSKHHILGKTNMIRDFGEFLSEDLKPKKKTRNSIKIPLWHQEPKF